MINFIDSLRELVLNAASHSRVPYSGKQRAALLLMSNGDWICGVRIENACYPLVIPALSSALASAASIGRRDVVAIVFSSHMKQEEVTTVHNLVDPLLDQFDDDVLGKKGGTYHLREQLDTRKYSPIPIDSNAGLSFARQAAKYASVPESDFPVGSIAVTDDHTYFHGTNFEHKDWTQILCAERAAIASAVSAGVKNIRHVYISCPKSSEITPCGACRQVLCEIAPNSMVWMDRGEKKPECFYAHELLPKAFQLTESLSPLHSESRSFLP